VGPAGSVAPPSVAVGGPEGPARSGAPAAGTAAPRVEMRLSAAPAGLHGTTLYAPNHRGGGRLLELATWQRSQHSDEMLDNTRLARTLQRLGFEVARTTPRDGFVSDRLRIAFLSPLVRWVEHGGDAIHLNGALRAAGFVRRPHALLADVDQRGIGEQLATALNLAPASLDQLLTALETAHYADLDAPDPVILDALCISLLEVMVTVRAEREVRDPSIADLIARELLDFPRHLCSLGTWLKRGRVGRALAAAERVRGLVSASALESARAFVAGGREFYR